MATSNKKPAQTNTNLYIVLALVTLLIVGVSVFAGKALVSSILHNNKVVSAKKAANDKLTADQDAAPKLIESYKGLSAGSTQLLKDALPNSIDYPSIISTLENQSSQAGLTLGTVAPLSSSASGTASTASTPDGNSSVNPSAVEYPMTITLKGSYAGIQKFFTEVENSARPMRITNVALTGNNSSMTANVSLSTYYEDRAALPFSTEVIK